MFLILSFCNLCYGQLLSYLCVLETFVIKKLVMVGTVSCLCFYCEISV